MANPNPEEDTEFNDILRKHGILGPKQNVEVTEDEIAEIAEQVIRERDQRKMESKTLDELDELEDDMDEQVLDEYRKRRIFEMQQQAKKDRFGDLTHISQVDWVSEVTKAGEGIWVVVHLFQNEYVVPASLFSCFSIFSDLALFVGGPLSTGVEPFPPHWNSFHCEVASGGGSTVDEKS